MTASDDELRLGRENRERMIARMSEDLRLGPEAARTAVGFYSAVITPPESADYRMPEHFPRTVQPMALGELKLLLSQLREFRTQLVGLTAGDAEVIYNGDGYAMLLGQELDRWIAAHVRTRLAKPSLKDDGNPAEKFRRLCGEFGAWVHQLVWAPGTGHFIPIGQAHRKLEWELYRGTLSVYVVRDAWGRPVGVDAGDPLGSEWLKSTLNAKGWVREGFIDALARSHPVLGAVGDASDLRRELAMLTHDLVEMRGLLARGFISSSSIVELVPGTFAGWAWEVEHHAGTVVLGETRELVADELESGMSTKSFTLDLDGIPREGSMAWIDPGPDVAAWALGVIRPVHTHLLGLWEAAERPPQVVAGATAEGVEAESIAAACEAIARADQGPEQSTHSDARAPRLHVPAVRAVTLLAMLERGFGCEVIRGKGSEITVWRPGGKKYILPGHKRNAHFHSHTVRALLQRVGIGVAEFCAAAGTYRG